MCGLTAGARGTLAQAVTDRIGRNGPDATGALIPRRLLFADPGKAAVRISPDGRRIAYLARADGVLNLFVASLDEVNNARTLTRVTDRSLGPVAAMAA
jgi:hypothetical protein